MGISIRAPLLYRTLCPYFLCELLNAVNASTGIRAEIITSIGLMVSTGTLDPFKIPSSIRNFRYEALYYSLNFRIPAKAKAARRSFVIQMNRSLATRRAKHGNAFLLEGLNI